MPIDEVARHKAEEAQRTANEAMSAVNSHEEICAFRYKHLDDTIKSLKEDISNLYNRAWVVAGTIIVLELGAIGALFVMILKKEAN